ncbi:TonB-dependent outer membrane transport protein [Melioribacter roseus P3M-2]|uniref:TonB-dependent outer membrane transport protein n=1 Tax=Melioribacter roseus (strain DSM 23840 / JCM 17771 / VKM B-2668 / P3M-2) TaxID=1191523 RepID=I7A2N1_MELRP|nr:TonB-dependent receptor [Melioribacter roseus]AFN75438.1 TonB-dependent outer membrane transport protein [Melioribacter roseus P3M-2]
MKGLFISFILLLNFVLQAQSYSLEGFVYDENNGEPLIGVNIYLQELKSGTTTDERGYFIFNNISQGSYTLRFSYIGHKSLTEKVDVPTEPLKIYLEDGTIDLNEVVITGNPFNTDPQELMQSSLSVANLDLQIKRSSNIGETLNFLPGISMRSNGKATARPVIRGFSNNRILILENGLRMGDLSNTSSDHAVSSDGAIPERIEIIRGPSSLMYGSNALGGVINIITEEIPDYIPDGLEGNLFAGNSFNNNEFNTSVDLHFGSNEFATHGNFTRRKAGDYTDGAGEKVNNTYIDFTGYQIGFAFIPDFSQTGLSYKNYDFNYGIPLHEHHHDEEEHESIGIKMRKEELKINLIGDLKGMFENISFKGGYQNYNHKEINRITNEVGSAFGLKSYVMDVSANHAPLFKNSDGVLGLWYQNQKYTVEGEEAFTPNADYNSMAFFVIEQFRISNTLLQTGLRYEYNSIEIPESELSGRLISPTERTFNTLSGSAGIILSITPEMSFYSNFATAFRAPTIEELASYAIHEATGTFDIGNLDLSAEKNIGLDLGLRYHSEQINSELNVYYNIIDDYIFKKPTGEFYNPAEMTFVNASGIPVYAYTQAKAIIYGYEFKAQFEISGHFSLTLMSDYTVGKNSETNEYLPLMPPLRFALEPRYSTDDFWIGSQFHLAADQKKVSPYETSTPGYGLINLYAGIKLITGRYIHIFSVKIDNLFDRAYREHLSAIKNYIFMPGREIKLNYRFLF